MYGDKDVYRNVPQCIFGFLGGKLKGRGVLFSPFSQEFASSSTSFSRVPL